MNKPKSLFDSFFEYKTKNILYGNYVEPPNDYIKEIMVSVIKSYTIDAHGSACNDWGEFYNNMYKNNPNYKYDDIINFLTENNKKPTAEYILSSALYGYKDQDAELLTRCLNTFCRPVKLDSKEEWLDNWTLNGPGNALNFIFWNKYNSNDVIVIKRNHEGNNNINSKNNNEQSIEKNNNKLITQYDIKSKFYGNQRILKIIGIFRSFLICNDLLPVKHNKSCLTASDITNISVNYFPFYYIGCGGCDMFDGNYTASVEEIKKFLKEYPFVSFGAIVNVSAFRSKDGGSHWMGLYLSDRRADLMCPQASGWDVFKDNGELTRKLMTLGFGMENNIICCQKDNCNCGVYSFLFLFMMLIKDGNMKEAVEQVGENANNIYTSSNIKESKNNTTDDDRLIYKIKNTLFGYE